MKDYPVYGVNSVKTLYYDCRKYRIYPNKCRSALIFHGSNRPRLFEYSRAAFIWKLDAVKTCFTYDIVIFRIELTELTSFDSDYS